MNSFFRSVVIIAIFTNLLSGSESIQPSKKYYSNNEASIMSFILLNHTRILHEIELGRGDYIESLITQKQNSDFNLAVLKILAVANQDAYKFAKTVAEYH